MNSRPSSVRWRIFLVLAFGSFTSYFLRSNFSIAAPTMIEDLGVGEIQWGWIMASFAAGYAIFQFPGGVFGDRFGARKALTIIAVLWGLFTILTAIVPGPDAISVGTVIGLMMVVRFLVGATHAPIFPVQNCAISSWFPAGGWALPHGLSSTGLTLGYAAAAPALAWLIVQYGWRVSFWIIAPLGFVVAAWWWSYARDNPADHRAVNEAEIALIRSDRPPVVEDLPPPPGWLRVLKNRDILLLMISYSMMNFVFWEVFTWFPYYWETVRGYSTQEAGWVTSSQWIAGAAGAALGGWFCDRLCKMTGLRWGCRWPILIGMTISGVLLISGAFQSNATIAVGLLALCFFFNQMTEGTYWATSIALGGQFAGAAGGLMNTGANLVGVMNALLVPWFAAQFGWTVAVASGGVFAIVGGILLLFVRADRPLVLEALAGNG
jgi:ACS family glucarate transporter-like MFS transporter